ncbi:hypothetical protein [Microseira sp. BLCC-F43]
MLRNHPVATSERITQSDCLRKSTVNCGTLITYVIPRSPMAQC